jgi:hypothetical protein
MVTPARATVRPDRLRALNVPSRVDVAIDAWGRPLVVVENTDVAGGAEEAGVAVHLTAPSATSATAAPAATGGEQGDGREVEEIIEEWRIDDEWWRTPIHRRYVEVVLAGGTHVVLFEDLVTGDWFMQRP